jgi:hypothetical protein
MELAATPASLSLEPVRRSRSAAGSPELAKLRARTASLSLGGGLAACAARAVVARPRGGHVLARHGMAWNPPRLALFHTLGVSKPPVRPVAAPHP